MKRQPQNQANGIDFFSVFRCYDTWEPKENMDCDDLLKEFEENWQKKKKYRFDQGETARDIVGLALTPDKKPLFLVMYMGSDNVELVPPHECNKKFPHLVIEFYESRQLAIDPDADETNNKSQNLPQAPAPAASSTGAAMEVEPPQQPIVL